MSRDLLNRPRKVMFLWFTVSVCRKECVGGCVAGECCDEECVGGCHAPGDPTKCYACRHYWDETEGRCSQDCSKPKIKVSRGEE